MRVLNPVVLVAAVGTFVDVLDLTLFQNVRVQSLAELGVPKDELFRTGVMILDAQLAGMFLGGLAWGSLADGRGRKAVLFASILVYSLATLACAFVQSAPEYTFARFICGFGLAGEFGAGVALISEVLPPETRGYGTTLCAAFGLSGALAGAGLALALPWRTDYVIGGIGGLLLLIMRARAFESGMFEKSQQRSDIQRGMWALFTNRALVVKYALALAIALPIFFVILAVVPFAPELTASLDPSLTLSAPAATSAAAAGIVIGDVFTGLASQWLKSRKRPIRYGIYVTAATLLLLLLGFVQSKQLLVAIFFICGLGAGYMVLFLTNAAEQFGTNVRGSATVLAPNFLRLCVIPMTLSLHALQGKVGLCNGALVIGTVCVVLALLALRVLPETFGRNLDFDESIAR
jgi:MFS transporter, putative metabolite:H+ symporter